MNRPATNYVSIKEEDTRMSEGEQTKHEQASAGMIVDTVADPCCLGLSLSLSALSSECFEISTHELRIDMSSFVTRVPWKATTYASSSGCTGRSGN